MQRAKAHQARRARSESFSERADRDEERLYRSAAKELWTSPLVDIAVNACPAVFEQTIWSHLPAGQPESWRERATAANTLASMAVRNTRVTARQIRSGYGAEAHAGMRRMQEIAGRAARVARDESGQYAAEWLAGRGHSKKPRKAFGGDRENDRAWELMSGMSHANFREFVGFTAELEANGMLVNQVGPSRHVFLDSANLYLLARHLVVVVASLHKVFSHIDDSVWLAEVQAIVDAEPRLIAQNEEWKAQGAKR